MRHANWFLAQGRNVGDADVQSVNHVAHGEHSVHAPVVHQEGPDLPLVEERGGVQQRPIGLD